MQFRYAFVVDERAKVLEPVPDKPVVKGRWPCSARNLYIARTYAYVAGGKQAGDRRRGKT